MRIFQIVVFVLASISFLMALYYTGIQTGESLWKGGMAGMIGDIGNAVNSVGLLEDVSDCDQRKYDLLADVVFVRTPQQGGAL